MLAGGRTDLSRPGPDPPGVRLARSGCAARQAICDRPDRGSGRATLGGASPATTGPVPGFRRRPSWGPAIIRSVLLGLNGGLHVHCDGRRERCSTTLSTAGGYVVAVTSVLSDRSVALASCYLADLTAAQTAVSHLRLVPNQRAQVSQRVLGALPSTAHARGCLLDHASELRELLAELSGVEVTIDVTESVLQRTGGAWAQR